MIVFAEIWHDMGQDRIEYQRIEYEYG